MSRLFTLASILFLALPASAQDFRWKQPLAAGRTLEIKNVNGAIVATAATDGQAEVIAVKRGSWRSDPDLVRIEMVESASGVTFCAVYPDSSFHFLEKFFYELFAPDSPTPRHNECKPGREGRIGSGSEDGVKVDFTIKVPAGVHFRPRNVNGPVVASALDGDVLARTVNGKIVIFTSGYAQARTVNGAIEASLGALGESTEFETVNGSIEVWLPASTAAMLDAKTVNGSIESEFPVTVSGKLGRHRMSSAIAGGGPTLSLETVNGSIKLRKSN